MKQPSRALQAEWRRKLARSGFVDLEGPRGELSNRGMPTYSDHGREPVPVALQLARRQDEEAYYERCRDILRTFRFRDATERDIWRRHTDGEGMHPIADSMGLPYHQVRMAVHRVWSTAGARAKRAKGRKCIARLVNRSDVTTMAALGALLIAHLRRTRTSSSTSA